MEKRLSVFSRNFLQMILPSSEQTTEQVEKTVRVIGEAENSR